MHRLPKLWGKLGAHLRLLRDDPERFGRNLLQFTNPQRFQERLLDVQRALPLHLRLEPGLRHHAALNVLQPVLTPAVMTGGPNTVVNLALWIALQGVPVRIVTARACTPSEQQWFWQHLSTLTGQARAPDTLELACAAHPGSPLAIGPCDMFMATHWTTAHQLKDWLPTMEVQRFFYLVQDFEPGFYPWSSNHALALQTYGLDHIGVFNEQLLLDYLVAQGVGRYAEPGFAAQSLVFEPAVDRANFHPPQWPRPPGPRRLLFYARASNPRNLMGLGLEALRRALRHPLFGQERWEFLAIGGNNSLPPLPLGPGQTLQPAPWADYRAYGDLLRSADLLLCPMLSPHTSYPVLEMAACGGQVVTTCFGSKTAARLGAISPCILGADPSEEALAEALVQAAQRAVAGLQGPVPLALPADWGAALQSTAHRVAHIFGQTQADNSAHAP